MKKRVLAVLVCLTMCLALFACAKKETVAEPTQAPVDEITEAPVTEEPKKEITLTFINVDQELGTLTCYAGEPVTGYEKFEDQEGLIFQGWFKTPTFLAPSARDLATDTFNEDTKLFGSFRSAAVQEDTRSWYIVGEGASPVLTASAWAGSGVDDASREMCRLQSTGEGVNEFAITVDLFEGDKFQIIYDWQWEGQKGYGRLPGLDKDLFENGGGLSGENDTSNVCVLADGSYTITLTTDPENAQQDVCTIVRNGDPEGAPAEDNSEPYVVTEAISIVMKGSWVADWSENIELERVSGTDTFTASKELEAGTELYFMVWDNGADTGIGMNSSAVTDEASLALLEAGAYNVKVVEAGTYTFTVDADTLTIVVSK